MVKPNQQSKICFKFVVTCMFLAFGVNTIAQTYFFENYNVPNLAVSKVYCGLQDKQDNLWFGTFAGVTFFDGSKFINYSSQNGLALHGVRSIKETSDGTIWFGHLYGGLSRFNNGQFETLNDSAVFVNNGDIYSIIEDIDHTVWLTTIGNGAFHLLNPEAIKEELQFKNYKGGQLSDRVFTGIACHDSSLILITDFGLRSFNRDSLMFERYVVENLTNYFSITDIFEDSKNNLWFGTHNGGLYKKNHDGKIEIIGTTDGLETEFIWDISEDSHHNIWVSCLDDREISGGISRISPDGKIKGFNRNNGLSDNKISTIFEDREGNLILGTYSHGIDIFKGDHLISYNEILNLSDNQIFSVYQDKDKQLWFGTSQGVCRVSSMDPFEYEEITSKNYKITNIRQLVEDNQKRIWIGTESGGIYSLDPQTKKYEFNPKLNNYNILYDSRITCLAIDKKNQLWAGTSEGLAYFQINDNKGDRLSQRNGLAGNNISALFVDDNENLWVASQGRGVSVLPNGKDAFEKIPKIGELTINCFTQDKKGNIWMGSGVGIIVYNGDSIINSYTTENGLVSNIVTLLNVGKDGLIYAGTNLGFHKIDPETGSIITYTEKNGFTGVETKSNASMVLANGDVWFGTAHGLMSYIPSLDLRKPMQPLTHITQMKIGDEIAVMHQGMKLKYQQNSITFFYNSICITNPDAVNYKIMLEGYNKEWQSVSDLKYAKYEALAPGKYTFKVTASNNFGLWNSTPESMTFTIKPPFYLTWWFILIFISILISAIYIYIKIRERNLIKEKQILAEKVEQRTKELKKVNNSLEAAYTELEIKNKDITDSIKYAQRIQLSILPPEIPFGDIFVLFQPKDIVSGDFYWMLRKDHLEFFAAVDCTGHGVPGAFMSFIGYSSLNKIVNEMGINKPSNILHQLNLEVQNTIHNKKSNEVVQDGMDIALAVFNNETQVLQYSGAYNPLILVRKGELTEYKATRLPIGHSTVSKENNNYINYEIDIEKDDAIYLYSDGYQDQFGGEEGKKYRTKPFKSLLTEIAVHPIEKQKEILSRTMQEWMGTKYHQIDDILVVGRKF